jgi:hypothetical protein
MGFSNAKKNLGATKIYEKTQIHRGSPRWQSFSETNTKNSRIFAIPPAEIRMIFGLSVRRSLLDPSFS